jgi:hypothetical protein
LTETRLLFERIFVPTSYVLPVGNTELNKASTYVFSNADRIKPDYRQLRVIEKIGKIYLVKSLCSFEHSLFV